MLHRDYASMLKHISYDPHRGVVTRLSTGAECSLRKDGYRHIQISGKKYLEHRLAWLLMTGDWPSSIDHIDGNPANNKWDNLREATVSENQANSRMRVDNSSGYKGVCYNRRLRKWGASLSVGGDRIFLGLFGTPGDAHAAYWAAAQRHHGEFARAA